MTTRSVRLLTAAVVFAFATSTDRLAVAEVPPEAIVGVWLFDDGVGTAAGNEARGGTPGVLSGGASWTDGRFGGAVRLSGEGQFVRVSGDSRLDPRDGDFSICFWVRPARGGEARVIWKDDGKSGKEHHGYFVSMTGRSPRFGFSFGDGSVFTETTQDEPTEVDEWHHVAVVRNLAVGSASVWVDGVRRKEVPAPVSDVHFDTDFCIGGRPGTAEMLDGAIDEVAVFRAALTEDDIEGIRRLGLKRYLGLGRDATPGAQLVLPSKEGKESFPMVLVASDGTGDFGPDTPGTKTAGIQEAIDHCAKSQRDLHIAGGPGVVYRVSETIHVLAVNDFSIDGGDYTIEWTGADDSDMIHVNAGLDAHYSFGTLVYGGTAAALRVLPDIESNLDRAKTFVDSEISVKAVRANSSGSHRAGTGVVLEPHGDGIGQADFYFGPIEGFAIGLDIADFRQGVRGVGQARIVCRRVSSTIDGSTLIRVGRTSQDNSIVALLEMDSAAEGQIGVDVAGTGNVIEATLEGETPAGRAVVFRTSAGENQVRFDGEKVGDPTELVTDSATEASNRVSSSSASLAVRGGPSRVVRVSSGEFSYTQRLVSARAVVRGGDVSKVELVRGRTTIDYTASSKPSTSPKSRVVPLAVGDEIRIVSSTPSRLELFPVELSRFAHEMPAAGVLTEPRRMTTEELREAVIVSWDSTGDFGPETVGTKTAGWQEAIDFAIATGRNVYVKGGWGGRTKGYAIQETIRIPAAENFHVEGGQFTLGYYGPEDDDLIVIDSAVGGYYQFGLIGNTGRAASIRVRPRSPLPDGRPAIFTDSVIRTTSIGQAQSDDRKHWSGIGGVVFDTSGGPIVHNEFFHSAPMSSPRVFQCGMTGHDFAYNILRAAHTHSEVYIPDVVLLTVGPTCHHNIFDTAISVNGGPVAHALGIVVHGRDNLLDITVPGGLSTRRAVIFERQAARNRLNFRPAYGADPLALIADRARDASNFVTLSRPARPIRIVQLAAGKPWYIQRLQPAAVHVLAGPSEVRLSRGTSSTPLVVTDETILLDVGDRLSWGRSAGPVKLRVTPASPDFVSQNRSILWSP